MSGNKSGFSRRDFLRIMGWSSAGGALASCDLPTTVTLEEGKEEVVSYLSPEEYVIPGIGVWYASTCLQCDAGCGIHGRVREGRALKLEGNPEVGINQGKTCMMGQSGVQHHYHPDRITEPEMKKGGNFVKVSWDEALKAIADKIGSSANLGAERFAWLSGTVSGHQSVLMGAVNQSLNSKRHYHYEAISQGVWREVCKKMLGDANPLYKMNEAKSIVSFGADFLGTWQSPVHFSTQYGEFRRSKTRGVLIQIEPKMSITGANADLWVAAKPGTEGILALAIANKLLTGGLTANLSDAVKAQINKYSPDEASKITGISKDRIHQIANTLKERSPSLVLAGATVEGQSYGYEASAAVMLLNIILGNVGKTLVTRDAFPYGQMEAKAGTTKALFDFATAATNKELDVVFIHNTNPVFTAPGGLKFSDVLKNIPFKVAFTQFKNETTEQVDLILPLHSAMEDWGSHVGTYLPTQASINIQQPLVEPQYPQTRGFGDVLLSLLKIRNVAEYASFSEYYAYLRNAIAVLSADYKKDSPANEKYWVQVLQHGMIKVNTTPKSYVTSLEGIDFTKIQPKSDRALTLIVTPRLGLWDGRHAHIPWLQEAPDQISKLVWDSWMEIHPKTAASLQIKHGDVVSVSTSLGTLAVKAIVFNGIHPDAVAIPMGQGHTHYGRYATGVGVNPMTLVMANRDQQTGELAAASTEVQLKNTGKQDKIVRLGAVDTQRGRKFVPVISASQYRRTEGG